jgi:hypothetical protein
MSKEPTEKGKEKYPPDGTYEGEPCTCKPDPECKYACKGECGCVACCYAYSDFLSCQGN